MGLFKTETCPYKKKKYYKRNNYPKAIAFNIFFHFKESKI